MVLTSVVRFLGLFSEQTFSSGFLPREGPNKRRTQGIGQWQKDKPGKGHEKKEADDNKYEWGRRAMPAGMN